MKRFCLIMPLMAMLSGCAGPTPDQTQKAITVTVGAALKIAAIHSPDTVKSDAQRIVNITSTDVIPFINTNTLPAATFLPLLQAKLIKIVPTDYEMLVSGIFTATLMSGVNIDITAPAMTATEKAWCLCVVTGIQNACQLYLVGKVATWKDIEDIRVIDRLPNPVIARKKLDAVPAEIVDLPVIEGQAIETVVLHSSSCQAIPDNSTVYCAPMREPAFKPISHTKGAVAYREAREHGFRDSGVSMADGHKSKNAKMAEAPRTIEPVARKQAVAPSQPEIKTVDFSGRVMLVFSSPAWCRYCKDMQPVLAPIAATHSNVYIIDPDAGPLAKAQALQRDVYAIPTYIVYDNGVEQSRHTGVYSRDVVLGWLAQ